MRNQNEARRAHLDRLAVLGEICSFFAHEVKNPLGAMLLNAKAALNWLGAEQPKLQEARQAIAEVVESAKLARDLITMIDSLAQAQAGEKQALDINKAVRTSVRLRRGETGANGVSVTTDLKAQPKWLQRLPGSDILVPRSPPVSAQAKPKRIAN